MPRFVSICALWPVFKALSTPGQAFEDILELHDKRQFLARSVALPVTTAAFGDRPEIASAMLVTTLTEARHYGLLADQPNPRVTATGTTCKLCERENCPVRSEPSMLAG